MKKVCGFNISSIHFVMMILPYINQELKKEKNIITFLETDLENDIKQVLEKTVINKKTEEKIININWKKFDIGKMNIENFLKFKLFMEGNLDIIVYGGEKYINLVNEKINQAIDKNKKNILLKKIKIIDGYEINDFKEDVKRILDNHDMMFNTSGEHKKEEIFKGYHYA